MWSCLGLCFGMFCHLYKVAFSFRFSFNVALLLFWPVLHNRIWLVAAYRILLCEREVRVLPQSQAWILILIFCVPLFWKKRKGKRETLAKDLLSFINNKLFPRKITRVFSSRIVLKFLKSPFQTVVLSLGSDYVVLVLWHSLLHYLKDLLQRLSQQLGHTSIQTLKFRHPEIIIRITEKKKKNLQ